MAENKGVLPSSNVNTLGNANNKWENVYANKFTGALAGNASTASSAAQLTTARSINGTSFNGTGNITTANWGTARNISIADATATNTGTGVSVNGSGNVTLKLPATIKASLTGNVTGNCSGSSSSCTGNAATATKATQANKAGTADIAKKVFGTYSGNGGQQGPAYFGRNSAGFLMSNANINSDTSYKNWLYMDNYEVDDAGGATALGVSRTAPRAFLMQSDANRNSWNNYAELLSTYNYNTYAPKKDGTGASGTWGISISGKANTAGTADTSKACSGNSATATKATQDSVGQQINTTYIKGLSISGNTITYTKGNGGTGSITVPTGAGAKGYITESVINNDGSWYRKWSDGWLEQGGYLSHEGDRYTNPNPKKLTFLKAFKNTSYTINALLYAPAMDASYATGPTLVAKGTTNCDLLFNCESTGTNAYMKGAYWYACGQS